MAWLRRKSSDAAQSFRGLHVCGLRKEGVVVVFAEREREHFYERAVLSAYKMIRRYRVASNVVEVIMLARLLGGDCLQQPLLIQHRHLPRPVCNGSNSGNGGSRVCTSKCTGGRLQRSQLSFTTAGDTPGRETAASFQGLLQGRPPRSPLRIKAFPTPGNNSGDRAEDTRRGPAETNAADQEVWVGERNGAPAGSGGDAMVGSAEFIGLVKAQFDVLVSVLGVDRVVLFARRENIETGVGGYGAGSLCGCVPRPKVMWAFVVAWRFYRPWVRCLLRPRTANDAIVACSWRSTHVSRSGCEPKPVVLLH